jgi:hypothetical protein
LIKNIEKFKRQKSQAANSNVSSHRGNYTDFRKETDRMSNIGSRQGSQSVIAQEANVRDSGNFVGSKLTIKKS